MARSRGTGAKTKPSSSLHHPPGRDFGESVCIEGASDAELFEAYYVERFLAPSLETGQEVVVVLDGLWGRTGGPKGSATSSKDGERTSCSCLPTRRTSQPDRGGVLQDR